MFHPYMLDTGAESCASVLMVVNQTKGLKEAPIGIEIYTLSWQKEALQSLSSH